MSLVNSVKFSYLADQLTDEETKTFLTDLVSSEPKTMIKALFVYFNQESSIEDHAIFNNECSEKISAMINARDETTEPLLRNNNNDVDEIESKNNAEDQIPKCKSLDELPQNVIGFIASFLYQRSYAKLSQCNRSTYLGCNTPKTLTDIRLIFDKYKPNKPMPDLAAYARATFLLLNLDNVSDRYSGNGFQDPPDLIPRDAMAQMQRLEKLIIRNDVQHTNQMESFNVLMRTAGNERLCQQITTLRVGLDFFPSDMLEWLCKFTNVRYLGLTFKDFNGQLNKYSADELLKALSKLEGLCFDDCVHHPDIRTGPEDGIFAKTVLDNSPLTFFHILKTADRSC